MVGKRGDVAWRGVVGWCCGSVERCGAEVVG